MVDGLIGFHAFTGSYSNDSLNVLAAFIQIGNIVYPPEKVDILVCMPYVFLFNSAGQ